MDLWPLALRVSRSERSPGWLRSLARRYKRRYVLRNVLQPLGDALEDGAGLHVQTWTATATPAAILVWFDHTIAAQPALGALDENVMSVVQGDPEVVSQLLAMRVPLPIEWIVVRWTGTKAAWWAEGRDLVADAIPHAHIGLTTVTDSAGTAFQTLFPHR